MMPTPEDLARIAEVEFADIVDSTEILGTKMRIVLVEGGFVDVWLSRKLEGRFGFHWEHEATGRSYRYDNFPNTKWKHVSTYPYHFHNGSQDNVVDSSRFGRDIMDGFRDFMRWVRLKLGDEEGDD
jgi:hypothetical protein